MKLLEMPPYLHPTSTVYIDRDKDYLAWLTKSVSSNIHIFNDGYAAAEFIESTTENTAQYYSERPTTACVIDKINSIHRFTEISVAVSAFHIGHKDLLSQNGLSVLSDITRTEIQTVILDSTMTDEQAIQALNSLLINFYISKDAEEVDNRVASIVNNLETRYFYAMSHRLYGEILRKPTVCNNYEFVEYFEDVAETAEVVEYYYVDNPAGFLAIDKNGVIDRYIAQDLSDYRKYLSTLLENPLLDAECVKILQSESHSPDFYSLNGDYDINKMRGWRDNLYPLMVSQGQRPFVFARIPACFSTDASYAEFRAVSSNQMQ